MVFWGERASTHKTTFGIPVVIGGGEGMKCGEGWKGKLRHLSLPLSSPQGFSEGELRWRWLREWVVPDSGSEEVGRGHACGDLGRDSQFASAFILSPRDRSVALEPFHSH